MVGHATPASSWCACSTGPACTPPTPLQPGLPHLHETSALLLLLPRLALGSTGGSAGGGGGCGWHLGRLPAAAWSACASAKSCGERHAVSQGAQGGAHTRVPTG